MARFGWQTKGNNPSWAWRSIIKAREFIDKHKAWLVKDGRDVKASGDKWLSNGERMWFNRAEELNLKVQDLLNVNGSGWRVSKLSQHLSSQHAKVALTTPLNPQLPCDSPIWPYTQSDCYSVKT